MIKNKSIKTKLNLVSIATMMAVSLLNVQTAFGYITPGGDSNRRTPVIPRPGNPGNEVRPTPTPRPTYPGPSYPRPEPVRPSPTPRPTPRPVPSPRPIPGPVYPGPVYPGPVYPGPIYPIPPVYPVPPINYTQYKTGYVNRWVFNETFYANQLIGYNYGYSGYRLRGIRVDVSGDSNATISLVVNGRLIDSRYTSGQDVYLYPTYLTDLSSVGVSIVGAAYVYNMVFELERYY
jgi:hypothetical protein